MAENELMDLFAYNLKRWLTKRDKTQADLRRALGVSSATASDWCNGVKMPRSDKIGAIACWLDIETDDLLTSKEPRELYTPAERTMVDLYRQLNDTGKSVIDTQLNMMVKEDAYRKDIPLKKSMVE